MFFVFKIYFIWVIIKICSFLINVNMREVLLKELFWLLRIYWIKNEVWGILKFCKYYN